MYRSPNIVRVTKSIRLRRAGHVARMEEGKCAFKMLTGKPTKETSGKTRCGYDNNIRIDFKGITDYLAQKHNFYGSRFFIESEISGPHS